MKHLSELPVEAPALMRTSQIQTDDYVAYKLSQTVILMRVVGRSPRLPADTDDPEEMQIIARSVRFIEAGVAKLGAFRIPLMHDHILARGPEAFKLLGLEEPTSWK